MGISYKSFNFRKKPFINLRLDDNQLDTIISEYCDAISGLDLIIINVVIIKPSITLPKFQILDTALTFSIQRIENDLNPLANPQAKFIIITDPGRVGKMRFTSRRIQKINYIPSKFGSRPYRREIKTLIDDPLPKDSKESYFIQIADLIAYIVYLYGIFNFLPRNRSSKLPAFITNEKIVEWLEQLKPILNLQAAPRDPFGVKFYP